MRKLAGFVQLNCTSSISIANFRLQARVINSVYKGFDAVNNDVFPSTAGRPVYQTVLYPSSASSSRRMVCLRPSCTTLPVAPYPRSKSRGAVPWYTTVQAAIAALPQGSSLRSGLCCPGPSSLSGRRRRAVALASVRRPNRACGFPAHGFHEDSDVRDVSEGINPTRLTSPCSL